MILRYIILGIVIFGNGFLAGMAVCRAIFRK